MFRVSETKRFNFPVCNNQRTATLYSLTGQIGKVFGDEDSPSTRRARRFDNPGPIRTHHCLAGSFSLCHTTVEWEGRHCNLMTSNALGGTRNVLNAHADPSGNALKLDTISRSYGRCSVSLFIDITNVFLCPFIMRCLTPT